MVRGWVRPPSAARAGRRSRSDPATASGAAANGSPIDRGGRGSRGRGRRGRGRGRRSAASISLFVPSSSGGHSEATPFEFTAELRGPLLGHLHLPRGFTMVMEVDRHPVFWVRAHGCSHVATQVHAENPKPHSMLLGRGRKAFTRAHGLEDGYVLYFKLMEAGVLVIKFYGRSGVRLGCCEERSSDI
ncbi:l-ascorbate oxidase-like protein [Hordeum vulgare]|nr:l-ascorbate oxidase-like protein [Hordeum vulgare]